MKWVLILGCSLRLLRAGFSFCLSLLLRVLVFSTAVQLLLDSFAPS